MRPARARSAMGLVVGLWLLTAGFSPAWATSFRIDEFWINKPSGTEFRGDSFGNTLEPPEGPTGSRSSGLTSPSAYVAFSTFESTAESGGKLTLDPFINPFVTVFNDATIFVKGARLLTSMTTGLVSGTAFDVFGVFDAVNPLPLGSGILESFFIEVSDRTASSLGVDTVRVRIGRDAVTGNAIPDGNLIVQLIDINFTASTVAFLSAVDLGFSDFAAAGISQVALKLSVSASGVVTAAHATSTTDLAEGSDLESSYTFTALGGSPAQIYSGVTWTRAGFGGQAIVPEPGTLLFLSSGLLGAAGYGWRRARWKIGGMWCRGSGRGKRYLSGWTKEEDAS